MERIASFCVDHTKLDRGMYLSRQDGDVLTWDIRMKKPNQGDYLTTGAAHTLEHLFATYARTDTDILMSQRMRSLQNQVVDIAPEQYQKLRQEFLNSLTVDMLNQYLRQQLSQDMALVLQQPKGEPEYNMKELQATWEKLMAPKPAATATSGSADTVDAHSEASDIPPGQ